MTSHEMVCHLGDAFLTVLGERAAASKETLLSRTVVKWIALHTKLPWPHGVPVQEGRHDYGARRMASH